MPWLRTTRCLWLLSLRRRFRRTLWRVTSRVVTMSRSSPALAFGFSPYRASQMPHFSCWSRAGCRSACWPSIATCATAGLLDLAWLGICWLMNGLTNGYYLVFFAVLCGLWMLWFVRERRDWSRRSCGTLGLASLPIVPVVIGHARIQGALGLMRGRDEIESYSADLTAFLAASSHAWLPSRWTLAPLEEGELYPGLAIVVLTLTAAVLAWRRLGAPTGLSAATLAGLAGRGDVRPGACVLGDWRSAARDRRHHAALFDAASPNRHRRPVVRHRGGVHGSPLRGRVEAPIRVCVLRARRMRDGDARARPGRPRVLGVRFMHFAPYAWLMELPGGESDFGCRRDSRC